MLPFFVLLSLPVFVSVFEFRIDIYKKRKTNIALFLFFALLTVLIMLRHESVGSDTGRYIYLFKAISGLSWRDLAEGNLEIGFMYLNKAISCISKDPRFFLATMALLITALIYPTYRRLNVDTTLTVALFCITSIFVMMFSGLRQMMAIGLGMLAYEATRSKKLILFLVFALLAMTMHASAFVLLFMYPLYYAKITKNWLYGLIPSLIVMFAFNRYIFGVIGRILEKFTKYEAIVTSTGAYTMILLLLIFVLFSFTIPKEGSLDQETIGLRNFLLLTLVIQLFAPLNNIAMRMSYYYLIFIPLLIPKIIECRRVRWQQVAIFGRYVMVVFFLFYFFMTANANNPNLRVFPYHFFWENVL